MLAYHLSFIQIDKAMMDELKEVKKAVNPTEVLLVVDAMTGQEAAGIHLLLLPAISVLLPLTTFYTTLVRTAAMQHSNPRN